jgi:hypothetical protein
MALQGIKTPPSTAKALAHLPYRLLYHWRLFPKKKRLKYFFSVKVITLSKAGKPTFLKLF